MATHTPGAPIATVTPKMDQQRERLLNPWPRLTPKGILGIVALIAVYAWGVSGTNASPRELIEGLPNIWNFLVRLFPAEWVM